jgi:hypothetical protein
MAQRGRKPTGPQLVEHLDGSLRAKTRLKAILETLAGQRTIPDVCAELGIQDTMFHKLRTEVLQTALGRLEPRPIGRPSHRETPADRQVIELQAEIQRLQSQLQASEVRRELAEARPPLKKPAPGPGKKTTKSVILSRRRSKKRHRAQ